MVALRCMIASGDIPSNHSSSDTSVDHRFIIPTIVYRLPHGVCRAEKIDILLSNFHPTTAEDFWNTVLVSKEREYLK